MIRRKVAKINELSNFFDGQEFDVQYLTGWNLAVAQAKANGGDRGIRTPDTVARICDFESHAFNQLCHISVTISIIYIKK